MDNDLNISKCTNTTNSGPPVLSAIPSLAYICVVTVVSSFGITGNCLTLIVFFKAKQWTSVNILLSLMSVSDLLSLMVLVTLPYQVLLGGQMSYVTNYFIDAFTGSSCLCACIVGCERAYAVKRPLKFNTVWTRKITIIVYIVGYIIILAITVARVLLSTLINKDYFRRQFYVPYFVLVRLVPFAVLLVTNFLIVRGLIKNRSDFTNLTNEKAENARKKQEANITRTVVVMTTVYFICMFPGRIVLWMNSVGIIPYRNPIIRDIQIALEIINFSVNIIIYTLTSGFHRKKFKELFCCCSVTHRSTSVITEETSQKYQV